MMASNPLRNWCFTWFETVKDDKGVERYAWDDTSVQRLVSLPGDGLCRYIVFQKEVCPSSGRVHLQGFIALKAAMRIAGVKKLLDAVYGSKSSIHLEKCNGTAEDNRAYCTKDESRVPETLPYEAGVMPAPGKKNDWSGIISDLAASHSITEFASLHPDVAIKNWNGVSALHRALHADATQERIRDTLANVTLRPVQVDIKNLILGSLGRMTGKTMWFYDEAGQIGKTTLCKMLAASRPNTLLVRNGKTADLAHAWMGQDLVIFDIPRSLGEEHLNMRAIEELSDGFMFSAKYESSTKMTADITVVVMSNHLPYWPSLSVGHWRAYTVSPNGVMPLPDPRTCSASASPTSDPA